MMVLSAGGEAMSLTLIWIALLFALVNWISVARGLKVLEYITKPAVMVCLIAWLGVNGGWSGVLLWFTAGLVFSLAGDVFLMLPKEQFVAGLVAFLLAHVAYVIGLNTTPIPTTVPTLIVLIMVGLVSTRMFSKIAQGLVATGNSQLKIPVLVYTIVISLMLFSALMTFIRPSWSPGGALLVGLGALLFYFSDCVLAWNKFVHPLKYGRLINLSSYHLGQVMITLGVGLQFLA
jgi:uncharacterized membrane protein YhhN